MTYPKTEAYARYYTDLGVILRDPHYVDILDEFEQHLKGEYNIENLLFWREAQALLAKIDQNPRTASDAEIYSELNRLYMDWIDDKNARKQQVNVAHSSRVDIANLLGQIARAVQTNNTAQAPFPDMSVVRAKLLTANNDIESLMGDPFGRFRRNVNIDIGDEKQQMLVDIEQIRRDLILHADEPKRVQELYSELDRIEGFAKKLYVPRSEDYNNIVGGCEKARQDSSFVIAKEDIKRLHNDISNYRIPNNLPIKDSYNKVIEITQKIKARHGEESKEYAEICRMAKDVVNDIKKGIGMMLMSVNDFSAYPEPPEEKKEHYQSVHKTYSKEAYYSSMATLWNNKDMNYELKDMILAYRHQLRTDLDNKRPFNFEDPKYNIVQQYQQSRGYFKQSHWFKKETNIQPDKLNVLNYLQKTFDLINQQQDLSRFEKALITHQALEAIQDQIPSNARKLNTMIQSLQFQIQTTVNRAQLYTDQHTMEFNDLVKANPDFYKSYGIAPKKEEVEPPIVQELQTSSRRRKQRKTAPKKDQVVHKESTVEIENEEDQQIVRSNEMMLEVDEEQSLTYEDESSRKQFDDKIAFFNSLTANSTATVLCQTTTLHGKETEIVSQKNKALETTTFDDVIKESTPDKESVRRQSRRESKSAPPPPSVN